MPPWRTTLEMCAASMPDSRATMASASSEVWRCCSSKSAGTYSASITGGIGSTLSSRTAPLQVFDSVAAVAIAGFARSVSARSIGTRMELNICASASFSKPAYIEHTARLGRPLENSIVLFQKPRTGKAQQTSAAECHVGPVVDREVEAHQARGRQIVGERPVRG